MRLLQIGLLCLALVASPLALPVAGASTGQAGDGAQSEAAAQPEDSTGGAVSPELDQAAAEAGAAEATEIVSEGAALAERVRALLDAIEGLDQIEAKVEAGVVTLTGVAPSDEEVGLAVETIAKLEGVLLVDDDVDIERDIGVRMAESVDALGARARDLVASLPLLGIAALILAGFWFLARFLRDSSTLDRWAGDHVLLAAIVKQSVYVGTFGLGVFAALQFLGAGAVIGTILGAAGVLGLALGFAFRNIVENYLAGVLLAIRQPFSARDYVEIDGRAGTVLRMTTSETLLMDANGNHVRLPNATIFNGTVINYSRNPKRRFAVAIGVGNSVDLRAAQELGLATLERMKGVLDDPAPSAQIAAFGDSTMNLEFFGWVHQKEASFVKVASEARRLLKEAFDEAGIDMPSPEHIVVLEPTAGVEVDIDGGDEAELQPQPRPSKAATSDAAPGASGPTPEEIDVAPEDDIERQISEELATSDEEYLLSDSPR